LPGHSFEYAIVRVVPRVDRDEFVNAGVILYCRALDFLGAAIALDRARLVALWPQAATELPSIERALGLIPRVCAGEPTAGPIAALSLRERFEWLVSPRSTITQTSAVHAGLCDDPVRTLEHLLETMVRVRAATD
jgi:hypothetical protein